MTKARFLKHPRGRPATRKPKRGERVQLSLRVTPAMKRSLDKAAKASGRSQSQEAELRLELSSQEDRFHHNIAFSIAKLELTQGDVLVVKLSNLASDGTKERIQSLLGDRLPTGNRVMIIDPGVTMFVLAKADATD